VLRAVGIDGQLMEAAEWDEVRELEGGDLRQELRAGFGGGKPAQLRVR
jgi:hypothetical protein